jgi:hypothetical protein
MKNNYKTNINSFSVNAMFLMAIVVFICTSLYGCGGGEKYEPRVFTEKEAADMKADVSSTLTPDEMVLLDYKLKFLSNVALGALSPGVTFKSGSIQAITPSQIKLLSPTQVQSIGYTSQKGGDGPAQIGLLGLKTWQSLMSDPLQIAAVVPAQIPFLSDQQLGAFDTRINKLCDSCIASIVSKANTGRIHGQIGVLTANQVRSLSTRQIQLLGTLSIYGLATPPAFFELNDDAWVAFASNPTNVNSITTSEMRNIDGNQLTLLGVNLKYLTDDALFVSQIPYISKTQISELSPDQISVIASTNSNYGISKLNITAFGGLTAPQTNILTVTNVLGITAQKLAAITPAAFSGFQTATAASFSNAQKTLLSPAQHTACGC